MARFAQSYTIQTMHKSAISASTKFMYCRDVLFKSRSFKSIPKLYITITTTVAFWITLQNNIGQQNKENKYIGCDVNENLFVYQIVHGVVQNLSVQARKERERERNKFCGSGL